jgi:hypothetical protein
MILDPKTLQLPSSTGCRSEKRVSPIPTQKTNKKEENKNPLKTSSKNY